jgi:hypothetical protein
MAVYFKITTPDKTIYKSRDILDKNIEQIELFVSKCLRENSGISFIPGTPPKTLKKIMIPDYILKRSTIEIHEVD